MKRKRIFLHFITLSAVLIFSLAAGNTSYLLDDFSQSGVSSTLGTKWRMFTDRVMGGLSNGSARYLTLKGSKCLRLQGSVSLENNGGFIQAALLLRKGSGSFDAGEYRGVRIRVLGNGETYYIHLRSRDTRRPWQYYGASFKTTDQWQTIDIPFDQFTPENLGAKLDTGTLYRIAVVAIKKKFVADVAVARLEFYR